MTGLIDAQALIWHALDDPRMPMVAKKFIASVDNDLYLSTVSVWEIVIKAQNRKLELDRPPKSWFDFYTEQLGLIPLEISREHVLAVAELAQHHRDPFDRLLIAQARAEGMPIITGDKMFRRYNVDIIW